MTLLRRTAIALLLVIPLLAPAAFANQDLSKREHRVDELFAAYDKPDSPGCALGIVHNGEFIYKRGYGMASLEFGVPLTPQSVFDMGSISKQFTAASVVLAAEQGYLSLDDDVRKYIPELPSYGNAITLRDLLHHTSGLRDHVTLLLLSGRHVEDIHPTAELLDLLSRQKALNSATGDEFLYSNSNYFLLGLVIHRASGKPLSTFAEENIFKPLGMNHSRFFDNHSVVVPGRVAAYQAGADGGFRVDWSTNFDIVGGAGLMSSVDDLLIWDRNFYGNKLGKGTLLREMQTRGVLKNGKPIEYALGLYISTYRGLPIVEHSGVLFGYRTELLRFPEQKFSVICLCNLAASKPLQLADQVADIYLDGQFKSELSPATTPVARDVAERVDPRTFVGLYRNPESHSVYELLGSGDGLVLFGQHLKAIGPDRFSFSTGPELQFASQGSNGMRLTVISIDAAPQTFARLQPINPSAENLAQYGGIYESSELQVKYKFAVKDGKLTVSMNWQEPAVLEPSERDEFYGPTRAAFVFRRDPQGHVSALDVFADRVRNIHFTRSAN